MRKTNRKLFMAAISLLLTVMMVFAMPSTVMAETVVVSPIAPTSVDVVAQGIVIDPADAKIEGAEYALDVWANGGSFSSYELDLVMPDFVQVTQILGSDEMMSRDNAAFSAHTEKGTRVNVAYSSAEDITNMRLFTVYFTVSDYATAYCAVECVKAEFVNTSYNTLEVNADLGFVQIGETSFGKKGDVNGDGTVTLADLLIIQRSMVNPNYPLSYEQFNAADIDKNGELTIMDCQYIQNYLIGRLDSLENVGDIWGGEVPTYSIKVIVMDVSGRVLIDAPYTATEGNLYTNFTIPVMKQLSERYESYEIVSGYSEVYGDIDMNQSASVYPVKADDQLTIIVSLDKPSYTEYTLELEVVIQDVMTHLTTYIVKEGQSYSEILLPVCEMLNERFNIQGVTYVYSDVYGEINENFNVDSLVVKANDHLKVVAVTDGESAAEVKYTYANVVTQPDGTVMLLNYAFYTNGTALFKMDMEKNGEIVDGAEQLVKWYQDGEIIVVEIPEMGPQKMFVVNKDNTLTPYEGGYDEPVQPDNDYIVSAGYKGRVGVVVGSDPSVLVKNACQQTITFTFSQSGEHVVQITPDMLDYSAVNFNEIGQYELIVHVTVNGREMTMSFTAYVIEDMSGVEILGTYRTDDTVSEMTWIDTVTVFANGKVMADDYYLVSYEQLKDNVIAFDLEGADIVLALYPESEMASFYLPEGNLIGTYVYTYETENHSSSYKLYFEVYGDYIGAGTYVTIYRAEVEGLVMWATSRVYLDLENRTLRHAGAPCTNTTIDENNNLIANHNFVEMVEKEPTCTEYGGAYIRCEYCGEYQGYVQLPMLGHQYEDGCCVNCGRSEKEDEELENYKQQALNQMNNEWENLHKQYGDLSRYQEQYNKYFGAVANATEMYIVDEYMNYFRNLVNKIHNNGGYVEPDHIISTSYNGEIRVMAGTGYDEFMAKYYPQVVIVEFSSGKTCEVLLTPDMVTYNDVDLNTAGRYNINVQLWVDGKSTMLWIDVCVLVNKGDVECLGSYQIVSDVDIYMYTIDLYADNTLVIDGEFNTPYETLQDNVICFPIEGGGDLVMVLNPESLTAEFYMPEDEVIGTYSFIADYEHGALMSFTVYGKYNGAGDYIAVYAMEQDSYRMAVTTRVYLDLENRVLRHVACPCTNTTIDENNNLIANHNFVETVVYEPTCLEEGWTVIRCEHCDETEASYHTPKLEHQYDEKGYCGMCGRSEKYNEELENYKQQALNEMTNEWAKLQNEFGDLYKYRDQYDKYYNEIINATETYIIDEYLNYFWNMANEIRGNGGGMGAIIAPMEWGLENGIDAAIQGESLEAYIEEYLVNNYLVVRMTDGTITRVLLDRSMVISINGDFSVLGQVEIVIGTNVPGVMNGMQASFYVEFPVWVSVQPDPTKLQLIGSYRFIDQNDIGWNQIDLYEGGVLAVGGMFYLYTQQNDNLIEFRYMSDVLLTLDHESKTACYYKPTEPVLGMYNLYEGDNVTTFTVYGEYYGAGDYVTVLELKYGDGTGNIKQTSTITTKVTLNLEMSEMYYAPYGNMIFDEYGNLTRYIYVEPDYPPVMDFEDYQDQIKDEIKMLWSEIDQGGYEVTQEQYEQYYSIMDRVYQVTEIWELDELRREAEKLCKAIKGIVELEWTSVTGMPRTVLVGTTMEQFYEMLSQVKVRMVYTDGSEVYASVSLDSFNLENLNLNVAGEYEISYSVSIEGQDIMHNYMTWIEVVENLGEGASVEYSFIHRIEGSYNAMEWTSIVLYENGYALIRDDSRFYFVEYQVKDDIIAFNYMDYVFGVLEYVKDEKGNVMGVAYYRPETDQIYIYDDYEDMYIAMEVFQLDGHWFAFFDAREYNRDGSQDIYEVTCDIVFNAQGNKIYSPMLDGWFEITEGNVLVPSTCDEHVFNENGRCEYCGMYVNTDNVGGEEIGGGSVSDGEIVENEFATKEELENMYGGNATAKP